jgi:hypothetical protein
VFTSTGNGGVSWNGRTGPAGFKNPPGASTDGALDISCATSSSCVVVGSSGAGPKVARTTNDGKSWTSGSAQ